MAEPQKSKTLYSSAVAALGFVSFILAAAAVALPLWGYYESTSGNMGQSFEPLFESYSGPGSEKGYFGPWTLCKELLYGRTKCGDNVSRFQPHGAVRIAGYMGALGVLCLAAFCVLSVIQLAMIVSKDKVVMKYTAAVTAKLGLALLATMFGIAAAGLFALQTDDRANDFQVHRGESFYVMVVLIVLTFLLFIGALYDMLFARRAGGDPTMSSIDPNGVDAMTYNNPGFRDKRSTHPGGSVSVTDASGKPYAHSGTNGSMVTLSTTLSSNGSTTGDTAASITRSPLRSSLKKPRPANANNGLGIQNPGFSGTSPTLSRNGSTVKKVRIQTHSTAV
ncbi:uncharacterized protein LOC128990759 isoform X1 [Macrosteles quadrilineatus]|uniref:uncharacterized protein LOC128990759 isoform X1 n=1 Tax=Macrosteles quadrilineatus TaxID=74068 RepID=UPI0023E30367|nr:uncharacterized protein LOC128990759 isoform X1 [Macrosteles quadrilineatus]XP_054269294.1 uncharacterized protein LOC128990759 isoform X1 [Macrosteles quadrilineatus]XP_054269295.1 uncharacterized protein LOC128990759 isoform X1 [Macrosteles quadrilineatus]XP_054269296.1 uncharacterized protein LOC128990759 isoform X1 [Macrosteles quadrilineatus]XP_054269297.1 uncharacterized protein LOC128990759 isoform X1 [Macrosteles quadrilineatus]